MTSPQLSNYLVSNRKRLALSQKEVAFLLGNKGGAKVSRYERFDREPSLETALALEVIFQRSASELFGGLYQKVEQEVIERARTLIAGLQRTLGMLSHGKTGSNSGAKSGIILVERVIPCAPSFNNSLCLRRVKDCPPCIKSPYLSHFGLTSRVLVFDFAS